MSVLAAIDRAQAERPKRTWHFAWMRTAYEELRERFASLYSTIQNTEPGFYWGTIESDETAVARLLLLLKLNGQLHPWLVPITRTYMLADDTRIAPGSAPWTAGQDGRDLAVRCRVAIASPYHYVLGFYAASDWARGRRSGSEPWDQKYNLAPLDNQWIDPHLLYVMDEWRYLIDEAQPIFEEPPENRVRRLAVQLRDLYCDIEDHRMALLTCESHASEFFGQQRSSSLTDRAFIAWRRHSTLIDASQKRIDLDLTEMIQLADGITADLEYGMQDRAGPTASQLMHALTRLHSDFHMRATNAIPDPKNGDCGYLWWHFDGGLQEKFKSWWVPIAMEISDLTGVLQSVSLRPNDAGKSVPRKPHRRRRDTRGTVSLTAKQTEAVQLIGECEGNHAEAARRMGVHRKTFDEHYHAALTKLGQKAPTRKATTRIACDLRGQTSIASLDDGPAAIGPTLHKVSRDRRLD